MNFFCRKISLIAPVIVLGLMISTQAISAELSTKTQSPSVPAELNLNKMLYGKFCSSCHGVDLKGTKQGPPFLHRVYHPSHHGDGAFFLAAKKGARAHHWKFGNMPPVAGTNEGIIASIVKYIRYVQKQAGIF